MIDTTTKRAKPVFLNGYWRAVHRGLIQPQCYLLWRDAARECR